MRILPVFLVLLAFVSPNSQASSAVTFNQQIAPIIYGNCSPCHHPGEAAPFSLLSYSDVVKKGKTIGKVTSSRVMPPWKAEPASYSYRDERRLKDEEIMLIQSWLKQDMPEGTGEKPEPPKFASGWRLGEPDLVLRMPEPYTLASSGKDIYRNFVIPIPTPGTRYVEAAEFLPGNPKIVHHAFMKIDRTRESRRLDEKDPEPGFSFMITPDSAQMPDGHFLGWQPGRQPAIQRPMIQQPPAQAQRREQRERRRRHP